MSESEIVKTLHDFEHKPSENELLEMVRAGLTDTLDDTWPSNVFKKMVFQQYLLFLEA